MTAHEYTETPAEQAPGESRVIEHAAMRAAELFEMTEDENWLGI